jgi:hypothetical protein
MTGLPLIPRNELRTASLIPATDVNSTKYAENGDGYIPIHARQDSSLSFVSGQVPFDLFGKPVYFLAKHPHLPD